MLLLRHRREKMKKQGFKENKIWPQEVDEQKGITINIYFINYINIFLFLIKIFERHSLHLEVA